MWFKLHRAVVRAFDAAGIKVWVAMASVLPFARDRVPLPWHAITEYGFLAADRSRVRAAFREQGLECNTRRGIVRCWFADGARIKSVYGSRLLTSTRTQTWPWADLFPYEAGLRGRGGGRSARMLTLGVGGVGSATKLTPRAPKRTKRLEASGTAWRPSTSG